MLLLLLTLDVDSFKGYKFVEATQLYSDDLTAKDTYDNPDAIVPKALDVAFEDGIAKATLHKLSWNVFRFAK